MRPRDDLALGRRGPVYVVPLRLSQFPPVGVVRGVGLMEPCEVRTMDFLREIRGIRYCVAHNALVVECERDRATAEVIALKAGRDEAGADVTRLRRDLAFERNRWTGMNAWRKKGNDGDAVG